MEHGTIDKSAASDDAGKFPLDDLISFGSTWLFALSLPHLFAQCRLHLVYHGNLISLGYELVDPRGQSSLRNADHSHIDTVSKLKVEHLVTDSSIILVQLIKFALFKKDDRIPKLLLDLPILPLER